MKNPFEKFLSKKESLPKPVEVSNEGIPKELLEQKKKEIISEIKERMLDQYAANESYGNRELKEEKLKDPIWRKKTIERINHYHTVIEEDGSENKDGSNDDKYKIAA